MLPYCPNSSNHLVHGKHNLYVHHSCPYHVVYTRASLTLSVINSRVMTSFPSKVLIIPEAVMIWLDIILLATLNVL